MYTITEQTAEEKDARSLVRVSERLEETARFFGPREKVMVDFGERGSLPLSKGNICRITHRNRRRSGPSQPIITLELFGFDEAHRGTDLAVVGGFWGSKYMNYEARGRVVYMGELDLLPADLVSDAIALLDGTGGIDLKPFPA